MPNRSCVESLGQVTDLWLNPQSPIRAKTVDALGVSTGFKSSCIVRAIDNSFQELRFPKLTEFVAEQNLSGVGFMDSVVLHVCAGNVFTSWLHGAVITNLMGYRCWIKPSRQEPVFPCQWVESLRQVDPGLAERNEVVRWNDRWLKEAHAVVAYGSDQTIQEIRQKMGSSGRFAGYGHKISVAIVLKEAFEVGVWPSWREKVIRDCELFDLQGCLSPQIIFSERTTGDGSRWKFLQDVISPVPAITSFDKIDEVLEKLNHFSGALSAVGVAGAIERMEPIRSKLERMGVSRICELGDMQRPPLSWRNGGVSLTDVLGSDSSFVAKTDGNA